MFLYVFSTHTDDVLIQFAILLHIISICFEPQTINELTSNNDSNSQLILFVSILIFFECFDIFIACYIHFSVRDQLFS